MQGTILVGTAGQGILRSVDDGATWHRLGLKESIEFDGTVRALIVDPHNPSRIFAGADTGISVSIDGGAKFRRLDSPANELTVWALAIDPNDPDVIYAGTGAPSRSHIFRSLDGGKHWQKTSVELPEFCAGVNRPRILTIAVDPTNSDAFFGVEEGGAWISSDRGENWRRIDGPDSGIANSDIHAITVLPPRGQEPRTDIILTVNSVYTSTSGPFGPWEGVSSADRFDNLYYTRTVQPLPGNRDVLLLAIGDGTPGTKTRIYRSEDRGRTWKSAVLHATPNSTFWAFGAHASNSDLIFAGTKYGHLFRSQDGGRSWFKEWREFSEITSIAWTPFVAPVHAHPQSRLETTQEARHEH